MNVKANMVISQLPEVELLYVPPSPDDTSQSIGTVYEYLMRKNSRDVGLPLSTPYLGRESYNLLSLKRDGLSNIKGIISNSTAKSDFSLICERYIKEAAKALNDGKVLGVIWGREEFGARALGNRSVVANPFNVEIKTRINEMIKDRDFWMPFTASILENYAEEYLALDNHISAYAYMTNTCNSTETGRKKLSAALHPYDLAGLTSYQMVRIPIMNYF